jgi:hypothetical protein
MIELWFPRYKDNKVLIAKYKVCSGDNHIIFTKAKHLLGMKFKISGIEISKCPIETNGTIDCYAVEFNKLERIN